MLIFRLFIAFSSAFFSPSFVFILRSQNLYRISPSIERHTQKEANQMERREVEKIEKLNAQIRRRAKLLEGSSDDDGG